jgi:hypothetical protein
VSVPRLKNTRGSSPMAAKPASTTTRTGMFNGHQP